MKKVFITTSLIFFLFSVYANNDKNEVKANLKSVTVYRSGAEMVHSASAILKAGNNEIIINDISNAIDSNSIQIKVPSSVTIIGFEFSGNYLVHAGKTERTQMLEDSLQELQARIDELNLSISNTKELLDVLKMNRDIKGEQNGLSVVELAKLMDYYESKSIGLQNIIAQQNDRKNKTAELANKIRQQIAYAD